MHWLRVSEKKENDSYEKKNCSLTEMKKEHINKLITYLLYHAE